MGATDSVGSAGRTETYRDTAALRPVDRDQLERWLCAPSAPAPSLDDLASAFGLAFEASAGTRPGSIPPWARFLLAVLRDALPTDHAIRQWLRTPAPAAGGRRPIDVLLYGQVEQLEELAVREWNRAAAAASTSEPA